MKNCLKKPKNYHLERKDDRICLELQAFERDDDNYLKRDMHLEAVHGYYLTPKTARSLAKRLLYMADWLEDDDLIKK